MLVLNTVTLDLAKGSQAIKAVLRNPGWCLFSEGDVGDFSEIRLLASSCTHIHTHTHTLTCAQTRVYGHEDQGIKGIAEFRLIAQVMTSRTVIKDKYIRYSTIFPYWYLDIHDDKLLVPTFPKSEGCRCFQLRRSSRLRPAMTWASRMNLTWCFQRLLAQEATCRGTCGQKQLKEFSWTTSAFECKQMQASCNINHFLEDVGLPSSTCLPGIVWNRTPIDYPLALRKWVARSVMKLHREQASRDSESSRKQR